MSMDQITEAIAHFIGLFEIMVDEGRSRQVYHSFQTREPAVRDDPSHAAVAVEIKAPYSLEDFDPFIPYIPAEPVLEPAYSLPLLSRAFQEVTVPWAPLAHASLPVGRLAQPSTGGGTHVERLQAIDPPGSVAAILLQDAILSDDDVVSLGGHGLSFHQAFGASDRLAPLIDAARALAPFTEVTLPGSPAEIRDFVLTARGSLAAYAASDHPGAEITLVRGGAFSEGGALDATYVNGVRGAEAPDYKLYRPDAPEETADDDGFEPSFRPGGASGDAPLGPANVAHAGEAKGGGEVLPEASVRLGAGGNTLVNSVDLTSNWLAATVTAVIGDHFELNAIVQINAWSDNDELTTAFGGGGEDAATIGFNIASFLRIDPAGGHAAAHDAAAYNDFPKSWVVTQVSGDLLIMNWIEQINFMTDNDISILAASGNRTGIVSGENTGINRVSLSEIGHVYDLIIVGGSIYDANMIYQMNVMLDDDVVGAVAGFSGGAGSSLSTGGNLLWNEASILNVGAADRFGALPAPYREAADHLAAGDKTSQKGVLADPAFEGMGALRVLSISGDIINLQFVKQTNVLGDADKVAAAMSVAQARPDAHWDVSTGANTLVNAAGIADVDALGKTLVGGGAYSDEILIQADLIPARPHHDGPGGDALVNEAVAFLSDGMLPGGGDAFGLSGFHSGFHSPLTIAAAHADPMHVLA